MAAGAAAGRGTEFYRRNVITIQRLEHIDINAPLKDARGSLKAEYTIEGMHITEEGYRSIFPEFMKYATEPKWG